MKKQFILAGTGIVCIACLFIFGRTSEPQKPSPRLVTGGGAMGFNIEEFIGAGRQKLSPSQVVYLSSLENAVKRGDVRVQQMEAYHHLGDFWRDSMQEFEPYAFYISKAAKLDNSEKSLTFAAQLFLGRLRSEHDNAKLNWEKQEAVSLFEQAMALDPQNDDLRIGLGSCYVFGAGAGGDPQETMKGIKELLTVVRKDSMNMKAQLVLGVGGFVSGQYDKAVERFQKVIARQPDNIEAIAFLADTYAARGDKEEAIKFYTMSKRLMNNPAYSKEVDERMQMLK